MINERFPALASRDFLIFWIGQFISLIGTWMQSTTTPYLAYKLTNQPFYLGLVGFAGSLPALLLTLPAGVLVERVDRRKTVIVLQAVMMLQAFAMAYLSLTGQITIWQIVTLSMLLGIANSIEITARQSMLIELVGKQALPNAIALNSTIFNAARVIGPTLAAPFLILLQGKGEGWAFFANGVSYLFVIVSLLFVHSTSSINPHAKADSLIRDFRVGQRYIRLTPVIFLLIVMAAVPGFFGFPFVQQIPVFAKDVLRAIGDTEATVATRNSLLITFQGIGALIAALTLAYFSSMRKKGGMLTLGQAAFAAALVGLAFCRTQNTALLLMIAIGWGTVTQLALTNTLIQLIVPDELRGRVIATYLWGLQGVAPFGSLFLGLLAQSLGAPAAVGIGGVICLITVLAAQFLKPTIRDYVVPV